MYVDKIDLRLLITTWVSSNLFLHVAHAIVHIESI